MAKCYTVAQSEMPSSLGRQYKGEARKEAENEWATWKRFITIIIFFDIFIQIDLLTFTEGHTRTHWNRRASIQFGHNVFVCVCLSIESPSTNHTQL